MAGRNQIIGGAFQDAEGKRLSYGSIAMQLSHDEQETTDPGQIVGGIPVSIALDVNGNIAGTVLIWPNDQLNPSGSYYIVNAFSEDGSLAWLSPYTFTIPSSPSPFDIGTVVPIDAASGGNPSSFLIGGQDSVQNLSTSQGLGFASATNTFIKATAGAGGITLTLPSAFGVSGQRIRVLMIDTGTGGVTIGTTGGQTINGLATIKLTNQYQAVTLESDNGNWFIVATAG